MELDRINYIALLFDIYKNMLTEKQQQVINNYVFSNLSLSEIAEIENISRQAVKDLLDRTINILFEYEEKLNIYKKIQKSISCVSKNNIQKFKDIWRE